jgi:hypothetical protein
VHPNVPERMLGAPTFVTQNGEAVNLTTETGESYRASPDWNAPYSRIWIDARGEGAVYAPDGMRIQFDDGRVWQRDIGPPPPVVFRRAPFGLQQVVSRVDGVMRRAHHLAFQDHARSSDVGKARIITCRFYGVPARPQ